MKIKWYIILIIVVLLIGGGYLVFNKQDADLPVTIESSPEDIMIGFSVDSMVIERWKKDVNILKSNAEALGYRVEVTNSFENADKQNKQIISLVDAGAKVIFIIPTDKDALGDSIEYAKKHQVIVIAYDRMINNANVDAYVSFDNVLVGEYLAEALIEVVPKGNYVIINGAPTDLNSYMFNEGYHNVLKPYIESGDIQIIHESWADGWREELAYERVNQLLEDDNQIDAIIGANDLLAEGIISALSEHGLAGKIPVVGHDAEVSACQRIVEDKQLMTVYKPISTLADGAITVAEKLLRGEPLIFNETINDGTYDVPYIKFEVIPVNKDNMRETVIKDLFHLEEDIYRNAE